MASVYEGGFIYLTAYNKLYVVDITDPRQYKVSMAKVNGSCYFA